MVNAQLLRSIPKVDDLLQQEEFVKLNLPHKQLVRHTREVLGELRERILSEEITSIPTAEMLAERIKQQLCRERSSLKPVINGTGVILHTNLGRAVMAEKAVEAVCSIATSYSNLELDLESGKRGSRYVHVETLLKEITGAEAAIVVNNNAAAVLLILSALGKGQEAIVSRGELVEIGGSFRIPDIMESCGCVLKEVGTTNKTRLSDYETAVGENTFALMKVHTSNFRVVGFTESVSIESLASLAHEKGLIFIADLGSGATLNLDACGIHDEPWVASSIMDGADIVCFSGDKLLGGPQAGIIAGRKKYLDIIASHPLMRAVRVDKMTLAALEATLRIYVEGSAAENVPAMKMFLTDLQTLQRRAESLHSMLSEEGVNSEIVELSSRIGGGSAPLTELTSRGIAVPSEKSPNEIETAMRTAARPVLGRIVNDCFCLDMRTLFDKDFDTIVDELAEAIR